MGLAKAHPNNMHNYVTKVKLKSLNKVNVGNLSLGCAFIKKWAYAW